MGGTQGELPGVAAGGRAAAQASQAATSERDKTFRAYAPDQLLLLPPALADWLPEEHLARFIDEVVETVLDLGPIYASYAEARGGSRSRDLARRPCRLCDLSSLPAPKLAGRTSGRSTCSAAGDLDPAGHTGLGVRRTMPRDQEASAYLLLEYARIGDRPCLPAKTERRPASSRFLCPSSRLAERVCSGAPDRRHQGLSSTRHSSAAACYQQACCCRVIPCSRTVRGLVSPRRCRRC